MKWYELPEVREVTRWMTLAIIAGVIYAFDLHII